MSQDDIRKTLHSLSDVAVTENTSLWHDIEQQLQQTEKEQKPMIRVRFVPRYLLVAAILLMSSIAVYAFSQIINVDEGLEGDRATRLVTTVNQSITKNDETVTLEWAYADANRIVFAYNVTDLEGNPVTDEDFLEQIDLAATVRLDDMLGESPDENRQIYDGEFGRVYDIMPVDDSNTRIGTFSFSYPADLVTDDAGMADLTIRISGGSGDFFSPYNFNITLPYYDAQFEIDAIEQFESDIDLTLVDFVVTKSMTTMTVCYTTFITGENLSQPVGMTLMFDDSIVGTDENGSIVSHSRYPNIENYQCTMAAWAIPTDTLPETISITIDGIFETDLWQSREAVERIVELFQERDVEVGFREDRLRGYFILEFSDSWDDLTGLEQRNTYFAVLDKFWENPVGVGLTEGPFTLTIDVDDIINTDHARND